MNPSAVVYVAWGDSHVAEAKKSLESLKKYTSNVRSYLFTDVNVGVDMFDCVSSVRVYDKRARTKAGGILKSFDVVKEVRVVYLDSDTLILGDISHLFEVANYYDVAMAHAPFRLKKGKSTLPFVSPALPTFNSGVIVYKKIHGNTHLFHAWEKHVIGEKSDQFILSNLIYSGNYGVNISVLPPEYNARTGWPFCVQGKVRIIHGMSNLEQVAKVVNQNPGACRVWVPGKGMIRK